MPHPTRRQVLAAGCAAAVLPYLPFTALKPKRPPNIIHIFTDDLGYGDLGCYGQQRFPTPRLDRMAAEGMRFTNHYTSCPVCLPARCCLMTGRHNGRASMRYNQDKNKTLVDEMTIPRLLSGQGYATGGFGKWSLGLNDSPGAPLSQGFDHFYGYLHQSRAHSYYPEFLDDDRGIQELPGNAGGAQEQFSHELIMQQGLSFIRAQAQRPFYAYFPITLPHDDFTVPDDELLATARELCSDGDHDKLVYAAMVMRIDRDVGRILDLLTELGIDDNTIVLFDSDNGPSFPSEIRYFNSAGGLRGQKRSLYEGGIRVPMVARWPGHVPAGVTSDYQSAGYDFLATLAELSGAAAPTATDGISFAPNLLGQQQAQPEYRYWQFAARRNKPKGRQRAVRSGDWKLYRLDDAPAELYHLGEDAGETRNLATKHSDQVAKLDQIIDANISEEFLAGV